MKKFLMLLFAAAAGLFFAGCSVDTKQLAEEVKASMEETFDEDENTSGIEVVSLIVVHESGNNYSGVAELTDGVDTETVRVDIVCDGESFTWEIIE